MFTAPISEAKCALACLSVLPDGMLMSEAAADTMLAELFGPAHISHRQQLVLVAVIVLRFAGTMPQPTHFCSKILSCSLRLSCENDAQTSQRRKNTLHTCMSRTTLPTRRFSKRRTLQTAYQSDL